MELSKKLNLLFEFVKEQHGEQKRKYTGEPYWKHLYAVAEIVDVVYKEEEWIAVALCHDLFEDTKCDYFLLLNTLIELEFDYPERICIGVKYLTDIYTSKDYPYLNRAKRKELEAKRLWNIPRFEQTIKYADLIDNTMSIKEFDPKFAEIYLAEKRFIISGMRKGDSLLLEKCEGLLK